MLTIAAIAAVIFLLSPIPFTIGLFKPQWVLRGRNRTRRKSAIVYLAIFVTSFVVVAITAPPAPKQTTVPTPQLSTSNSQPSAQEVTPLVLPSPLPSASTPSIEPSLSSPSPAAQPSVSTPSQPPNRISANGAGLGDTRQNFEKVHGANFNNKPGAEIGRYENDYLQLLYADDVVRSVGLQFGKTPQPHRTRTEALQAALEFLPSDAVKIKEWQPKSNGYAVHYESQKLASAFPEKWQKVFWNDGVKPRSFFVLLTHEDESPDAVFSVIIEPGELAPTPIESPSSSAPAVGSPIREAIQGSCQCPYDTDRRGRSCGGRSAYSKPSGSKPQCYVGD